MLTFAALAWWRWPRRRAGGRRCRPLGETSPGDAGIPVDRQAGGRLAPGRRRNGARRRLLGPRSRRLGRIRAGRDVHRSAVGGRLRGLDTGGERTSVEKEQGWPGPLGGAMPERLLTSGTRVRAACMSHPYRYTRRWYAAAYGGQSVSGVGRRQTLSRAGAGLRPSVNRRSGRRRTSPVDADGVPAAAVAPAPPGARPDPATPCRDRAHAQCAGRSQHG
jgi:hypothetical protein